MLDPADTRLKVEVCAVRLQYGAEPLTEILQYLAGEFCCCSVLQQMIFKIQNRRDD